MPPKDFYITYKYLLVKTPQKCQSTPKKCYPYEMGYIYLLFLNICFENKFKCFWFAVSNLAQFDIKTLASPKLGMTQRVAGTWPLYFTKISEAHMCFWMLHCTVIWVLSRTGTADLWSSYRTRCTAVASRYYIILFIRLSECYRMVNLIFMLYIIVIHFIYLSFHQKHLTLPNNDYIQLV